MLDAAKDVLQPPEHVVLTERAWLFWPAIIKSRARDEWTENDLVVACQLAECQSDIASETILAREEGRTLTNDKGAKYLNPRHVVVQQLAATEMAYMRTLRMGGRIAGDSRNELNKRKIERDSRKVRGELEEENDGLLAR